MSVQESYFRMLEIAYAGADRLLATVGRWLKPGGGTERVFVFGERASKGVLFNCQMCGQCVLHSTGMTCPMNCPKNMRNGPCGGVRANGRCEIRPEMTCVWLKAWERSGHMRLYGGDIHEILAPLDRRKQGSSAWINEVNGLTKPPPGWAS
jgi:hypothetical protein